MYKLLFVVLGLTPLLCAETNGAELKQKNALPGKPNKKRITYSTARAMIKMRHDYEALSSSMYPLMAADIDYMIKNNLYSQDLGKVSQHTVQDIFNASSLLTTKTLEIVKALPENIDTEIQYRILFFLARTGCHNYIYFPANNYSKSPSLFMEHIVNNIHKDRNFFKEMHNKLSLTDHRMVFDEKCNMEIIPTNEAPKGKSYSTSSIDQHDQKAAIIFNVIDSLFNIEKVTIVELSKYNLLFYYKKLKHEIHSSKRENENSRATLIDIYNNIHRFLDFKKHVINFDSNLYDGTLVTLDKKIFNTKMPPLIQPTFVPILQKNMSITLQQQRLISTQSIPHSTMIQPCQMNGIQQTGVVQRNIQQLPNSANSSHAIQMKPLQLQQTPQNLQPIGARQMVPQQKVQQITGAPTGFQLLPQTQHGNFIPIIKQNAVNHQLLDISVTRVPNSPDAINSIAVKTLEPVLSKSIQLNPFKETDDKVNKLFQNYPNIFVTRDIKDIKLHFKIAPLANQALCMSCPYIYNGQIITIFPQVLNAGNLRYLINKCDTDNGEYFFAKSDNQKDIGVFRSLDNTLKLQGVKTRFFNMISIPTYINANGLKIELTPTPILESNLKGFVVNTINIDGITYYLSNKC